MIMKYIKYLICAMLFAMAACDQEVITLTQPETPNTPDACEGATKGSLDLTKFVAVGNSFVAGVQGGALFTSGQDNSLAAIINRQLVCAGAPEAFNQPNIHASLGWNLFVPQPFLADNTKPIYGRMLLQYNGAASPRPTPQQYTPGSANFLEAVPNPAANAEFIYDDTPSNQLNNFAVPTVTVGQTLTPATGNWADPDPAKGFTPFYARFASAPGTSTIISDVDAAGGTTALVWLGLDDFFLYAAFGGDPTKAPLTAPADFQTRFGAVFGHPVIGLLHVNPTLKAVVGNFPNIFAMPHFTSVPWNAIVFAAADEATVNATNGAYDGYNEALHNVAFGLSDAEIAKRTIHFAIGANGIVIEDETLTNLTAYGVPSIRQTTAADIIPLSAANVLGTQATPGNPATTWGVGKALTDQYALIPSEIAEIEGARNAYNAIVAGVVAAFPDNLALADVNAAMNTLVTNKVTVLNGVTLTPNINPPTGMYSEDGVHPNTRGYAFLSRVFIEALNTKFGATIPLTSLADYSATGLPIP